MKLIDASKLHAPAWDEVNLQPYVKLAREVREAEEVRAIPEEYIEALIQWVHENNPIAERSAQAITLTKLIAAYQEDWRPWDK